MRRQCSVSVGRISPSRGPGSPLHCIVEMGIARQDVEERLLHRHHPSSFRTISHRPVTHCYQESGFRHQEPYDVTATYTVTASHHVTASLPHSVSPHQFAGSDNHGTCVIVSSVTSSRITCHPTCRHPVCVTSSNHVCLRPVCVSSRCLSRVVAHCVIAKTHGD